MPVQPRTPPGVLELLPPQQIAFQHILDTIRHGFERFGFLPIETPAFELTSVLLTKSGGETEKQVYYVQSTGAHKQGDAPDMALRFDLTVPLARYVAQHENDLNFPFRRYQIQRVYRGERNQKGRYREFYQCDIDVIGKDKLAISYDAELPAIIFGILAKLDIGAFAIEINNRKLLRGLLEGFGFPPETHGDALHEIDRLGKMSSGEVRQRIEKSFADAGRTIPDAVSLLAIFEAEDQLAAARAVPNPTPSLAEGLAELEAVYRRGLALGVPASALRVNLSIARGLDYYTGTVYETFLTEHRALGSICSGGRYDNLAEHYTKSKLPGVGISIGITRLLSHLLERGVAGTVTQVFMFLADEALATDCAHLAAELRAAGLNVDAYGSADKLGKQFKYAARARIPVAVLYGEREKAAGQVKIITNFAEDQTKIEELVPVADLVGAVQARLRG